MYLGTVMAPEQSGAISVRKEGTSCLASCQFWSLLHCISPLSLRVLNSTLPGSVASKLDRQRPSGERAWETRSGRATGLKSNGRNFRPTKKPGAPGKCRGR